MKTSLLRQLVILPLLIASMALLHACSASAGRADAAPGKAAATPATSSAPLNPAATGSAPLGPAAATPAVATPDATAPGTITRDVVLTQGASVTLTPAIAPNRPASDAGAPQLTLERINDSRCRQGMVCVWAGYISYSFVLTGPEGRSNFVLSENMPNASASTTRQGWTITLTGLEPQAAPAKNETTPQYRVSLRVSNAPSS